MTRKRLGGAYDHREIAYAEFPPLACGCRLQCQKHFQSGRARKSCKDIGHTSYGIVGREGTLCLAHRLQMNNINLACVQPGRTQSAAGLRSEAGPSNV